MLSRELILKRGKFLLLFFLLSLFILFVGASGQAKKNSPPAISVIYPRQGARIGASDSTFIFGSVTPRSRLSINGSRVKVHPNGAFLAFLPLQPGDFTFELVAENKAGTSTKKVLVKVPTGIYPVPSDSFCIVDNSISPNEDITLTPGDVLEARFRGTPNCQASFSIEGIAQDVPMIEASPRIAPGGSQYPWGTKKNSRSSLMQGIYTGSYTIRPADTVANAMMSFKLTKKIGEDSVYVTGSPKGRISVNDDQAPQVVEFVGSAVIARSGPKLGYTLLYQPPGIKAVATGKKGEWVRLRLAPGENAWVHQDSITYLPQGTPIPKSILTTIHTKLLEGKTRVTLFLQENLPFRVEQQTQTAALFLTVYGVTSNTDWIRYDSRDELIREIRWEQLKENAYQLEVFLNQKQQWGYDVFYEGNHLILEINHQPEIKRGLEGLRICLDPGHCPDPGAVGPTGLEERVVNLEIARRLKKILERNGAEVIMTRSGMDSVHIYDRPQIAIQKNADLLISIHNNALPDGVNPFYNNGTSTYYYHPQALALAREIQAELLERLKLPDFGIYYANLVLTRPSQLPSVLVECAFMMIPEQEALLRTEDFHKKCAQAIYRGIRNFVEELED